MSGSPPSGTDGEDLQATYAGAKRRIAALELQIQNFVESGSKRKWCVFHHPPPPLRPVDPVTATLHPVLPKAE